MKKNIYTLLTAALAFTFFSCTNILDSKSSSSSEEPKNADGKTCLVIGATTIRKTSGRAASSQNLAPTAENAKLENLKDLVLEGKLTGESQLKTLAEADSFSELPPSIAIDAGNWEFKLSADLNGVTFSSGLVSKTIYAGRDNTIRFVLTSELQFGGLEITVNWTNTANKVVATLMNAAQTSTVTTKTFDNLTTSTNSITFTRNMKDKNEHLSSGTYYLEFKFYDSIGSDTHEVGYFDSYVNIADGLITKSTITGLDLTKIYKITYNPNGGELAEGETQPLLYSYSSKTSTIRLPEMSKLGFIFAGWYEDGTFSGEPVTSIPAGSTGAKTFHAKWDRPSVYVSGTGDDTTGDGTKDNPYASIDKACEHISNPDNLNPYGDWIIYITGEVKGVPRGSSGTDLTYGPNTISEDINGCAKSILLTGTTPITTEFAEPQDYLNRNQASNPNGVSYGTVLTVDTSVPVTITNLKITGGIGSGTKGAGLHVSNGATIMLGDGVLLIHNRAGSNSHGGAIQNEGTLFIYGTAVIGDKSKEEYVYDSSTDYNFSTTSNRGGMGGGVYNGKPNDNTISAKLYLGYKGFASDGVTPVKEELKGGFYHNGGSGGALYNCENCYVYFDSGTFAWNGTCASGGAICNAAGGTIKMTGGSILNNRAYEGGSYTSYGGGVSNYGSTSVFVMSGGIINKNVSANDSGYGGGVYNKGKFYLYGTAVIGDKTASTFPNATNYGNKAQHGGGIFNAEGGNLFIGYMPDDDGNPVKETLKDGVSHNGIYYNYSFYKSTDKYGGGGIESTGNLKIVSGTIAYNATEGYGGGIHYLPGSNNTRFEIYGGTIVNNMAAREGGAIFLAQKNAGNDNVLYLCGTPNIPKEISVNGYTNYLNDIYIQGKDTSINLSSPLSSGFAVNLTFSQYNTTQNPLRAAANSDVSLANEYSKFKVTDQNLNGRTKKWALNASGYLTPVKTDLYISENGSASNDGLTKDTAFADVSSALAKIWTSYQEDNTNANQDYIIYISGTVKGGVNIEDMAAVKYANSITFQGFNGLDNTTNLPKDTLDGNFSEGTAGTTVSVNSKIPIAIKALNITGAKRTTSTSSHSGLYITDGSTVSLEDGTVISGNDGGVLVANSTLIIDGGIIKNNSGKSNGAGIFTQSSTVKMLSGSITNNTFNTDFLTANSITEVSGGGIYLSDDSLFEMTGGTISTNATGLGNSSVNILGKGIYVSENAIFNIGDTAAVSLDNDVYLNNNVKVNVMNVLKEYVGASSRRGSAAPAAILTPAIYPTLDAEGNITQNIELLNMVDSGLNMYEVADQFRITPQVITNGLQYWRIGNSSTNTETYGKLVKISGTTVNVSITTGVASDINVVVTNAENQVLEKDLSYAGGGIIIFTADSGYASYKWKLDNVLQTPPQENVLQVDTSGWDFGVYDITLETRDNNGARCSYTAQIRKSAN